MNTVLPQQHINCPNCGSSWNAAEVKDQECFSCGYPDPYDKENDDDTED